MKDVVLVVPTIREPSFQSFLKRWGDIGLFDHVDLIVMEDNPTRTFSTLGRDCKHFCWEDIERDLSEHSWIIPRRSDTVRSFAYWKAWKFGYKYIMTLDDDCYPPSAEDGLTYDGLGFVSQHIKWIENRTRWYNTLNDNTPRGVPYYNRGTNDKVVLNHGLWTNVLDFDAPHQLAAPAKENYTFDNNLVPHGSYFPMCGMNLMWKSEITVLMYHLLMGQMMTISDVYRDLGGDRLDKLPFDRFGDIWCGIIMKKICDSLGFQVSTGMPYIRHDRASNPFTNLRKEANGIEVNEKFWDYVDKANIGPSLSFVESYAVMGGHIQSFGGEHGPYFTTLGIAMLMWAALFDKAEEKKYAKVRE